MIEEDPNVKYDRERCRICAHPLSEQPRTWGCGHCCPADAPEVPSRDPKRYWKDGLFYPAGIDRNRFLVTWITAGGSTYPNGRKS